MGMVWACGGSWGRSVEFAAARGARCRVRRSGADWWRLMLLVGGGGAVGWEGGGGIGGG